MWTEKNMNGRNFLQNLFGQKFVSIEVPGMYICMDVEWDSITKLISYNKMLYKINVPPFIA